MAKYELNIFKDDEIEKTVTANFCPWGVFSEAAAVQARAKKITPEKLIAEMENIVLKVFPKLTKEELRRADGEQVMAVFMQVASGNANGNSKAIKNA